jgi:hypothetical protein
MRLIIIGLRCGAVILMIVSVYALSALMRSLPWQADCALAAASAFAFAYRFERRDLR